MSRLPIQLHASLQLYAYAVGAYFLHQLLDAGGADCGCRLEELVVKLLPVLTLVFVLTKRKATTKYAQTVRKALLWSALGDAFLVFIDNDVFAVAGAVSFVLAHVQYRRAFQLDTDGVESPLCGVLVFLSAPLLLLLGSGHSWLLGCLAKCYLVLLFYVMSKAFNKFWHLQQARTWAAVLGLFGAASFIVSDVLLLCKELSPGRQGGRFAIMLTYYAAQYGLAASAL